MQVLEKVSKAILDDYKIQVVFRGTKAYTDGKKIVLPSCPESISESEMDVFRGYCDHEIAHVLFTDFGISERPELRYAVNAMEDIRVEARLREKFIGSSKNITKTILKIVDDMGDKLADATPFGAITIEGRRVIHGIEDLPRLDIVYEKFGSDIIDRIVACKNTAEIIALAEELYEKSKEPAPEKKPEQPKGGEKNKEKIVEQSSEEGLFEDEEPNFGEPVEMEGEKEEEEKEEGEKEESGSSDNSDSAEEGEDEGSEGEGSSSEGEESEEGDSEGSGSGSGEGEEEGEESSEGSGSGEGDEEGGSDDENEGGEYGKGEGEDGDGEGFGDGDGSGEGEGEPSEGEPEESDEAVEGGVGAGANTGCKSLTEKDFEPGSTPDIMDAAKELMEGLASEALHKGYIPFSTQYDKIQKAPFGELSNYERMYEQIKATKGALVKEFESKTKAVWDGEKKSGKINARRLASLQAGNTAVFRQRRIAKAKKTSVSLLVDCSGSMNDGKKNHQAFKVATLLAETCNLAGVEFEILGFTATYDTRLMQELNQEANRGGDTSHYGRDTDALVTYEIKTFKEKFGADAKKRIAGYRDLRYSNNADAESISLAAQRLAAQRSDRKILIVISDGQPATRGNMSVHKKALKKNIAEIEKAGIEVVGIGILSDAVKKYYQKCLYTKDFHEFQTAFVSEIRNILKVSEKK